MKRISRKSGKSVSRMVADYFSLIDGGPGPTTPCSTRQKLLSRDKSFSKHSARPVRLGARVRNVACSTTSRAWSMWARGPGRLLEAFASSLTPETRIGPGIPQASTVTAGADSWAL